MACYVFARFHARPGQETAMEQALHEVLSPTREEASCLETHTFRSTRDPGLFYIHSRWKDEAAFDTHAGLPHTRRFLECVEPLLDQPREVTRSELLE